MTVRARRTWDRADLRALPLRRLLALVRLLAKPDADAAARRCGVAALEEAAARLARPDLSPSPTPHRGRGGVGKANTT